MSSYSPNPVVTIAGSRTYADNTISSINITAGRNSVMEACQPGYASLNFWTDADDPLDINIADSLQIQIDKATTGSQTLFTGVISDVNITLEQYGNVGSIAIYSVTAVDALASLNRKAAGGAGYPQQKDGDRIFAILRDAFLQSWDDVGSTLTWDALDPAVTWENFDGPNKDLVDDLSTTIDQPGQYLMTEYEAAYTTAFSLSEVAAQTGRGQLFSSNDGKLIYKDYVARNTSPTITLTADDLLTSGLTVSSQWSEISNDINVSYTGGTVTVNKEGMFSLSSFNPVITYQVGSVDVKDENSIAQYGPLLGQRATSLVNPGDAASQGQSFLQSRSFPRTYPERLSVALHSPTVSDTTKDELLDMTIGVGIYTEDLPRVFGTVFDGFIESYNWQIDRYTATLNLTCSAYSETYFTPNWYQIPPTTTWAGYTPSTTEWQEL
jgi:hypothetical protein